MGNSTVIAGALATPLSETERWRRQEISEDTEDLNDIINQCELIEIQSFKPNRENKVFGYTWNINKNWPCTMSQEKF